MTNERWRVGSASQLRRSGPLLNKAASVVAVAGVALFASRVVTNASGFVFTGALLAAALWWARQAFMPDTHRSVSWRLRNIIGISALAYAPLGLELADTLAADYSGIGRWPDPSIWLAWGYGLLVIPVTIVWGGFQWDRTRKVAVETADGETEIVTEPTPVKPVEGWMRPVWVRVLLIAGWLALLSCVVWLSARQYAIAEEWRWSDYGGDDLSTTNTVVVVVAALLVPAWALVVRLPKRALPRVLLAIFSAPLVWITVFGPVGSHGYDAGRDIGRVEVEAARIADNPDIIEPGTAPLPVAPGPNPVLQCDSLIDVVEETCETPAPTPPEGG